MWLSLRLGKKFASNLLYRATSDGFTYSAFHNKCDGKGATISLIKSEDGLVFGGYASKSWNSGNTHISDPNAFLFSVTKRSAFAIKSSKKGEALSPYTGLLCSFGAGDLYIYQGCDKSASSYSDLGMSYSSHGMAYASTEARDFLAGSYTFKVLEVEVYQISYE